MNALARLSIPLLVVGIASVAAPARGDVIQVSSGTLVGDPFGAHLSIQSPSRGFSLSASGSRGSGTYDLAECNASTCNPGDTLSLAAGWNGVDFGGTVTIDGSTFLVGLITNSTGAASAHFAGTWTAPAFTGVTTATVIAPFTFTGGLAYPDSFMLPEESLAGGGVASIQLEWNPIFNSWGYTGSTYNFTSTPAATPEPTTLLLVAPFAVGLLRRFRKWDSHPSSHFRD